MIQNLPQHVSVLFILTVALTIAFLYRAAHNNKTVLLIISTWLLLQGILAYTGFYLVTTGFPPRFIFVGPPAFVFIIAVFVTKKGKAFIDNLNLETLNWLHVIRIPVELVLYALFVFKAVPQLMTFEGRNFDIISGITAPFIAYYGYRKQVLSKGVLLLWNFVSFALLANIVITAILSAPFQFQKLGFEQPDIAILYFPFIWLPCCVVPIVLFAHLVSIRKLLKK